MPLAQVILLRLLACCAVTFVVWRWVGVASLVLCAPLFGVLLARPILELVESTGLLAKRLGYRRIEGRHYEHQGRSIDITEDAQGYRWVSTADVRKLLPGLPNDRVLARLFPGEIETGPAPALPRIRAEALDSYLAKATEPGALKFRLWVQREVVIPADKSRQRRYG